MPGIWGDGQRGGIFGAKIDPRLLAKQRIADAFAASEGMQQPSEALYAAKHRRAQEGQPVEPGFWSDLTSMGPGIRGGLKAIVDPRTSPLGPAAIARMFFDPAGEAGRQVETGEQLAKPFTQFNDLQVDPVKQGADLALTVMGGSSVVPAEANSLRMGIRAYHGSPHDFERFDSSKIGTGEGAQAYGHGMYFAEKEGVARDYRNTLAPPTNVYFDGKKIHEIKSQNTGRPKLAEGFDINETALLNELGAEFKYDPSIDIQQKISERLQRVAANRQRLQSAPKHPVTDSELASLDREEKLLKRFQQGGLRLENPGKMYEVDIAADPEHFLDWDKPLSEQSPQVRRGYVQAVAGDDPIARELLDESPESLQIAGLFPRSSGAQAYNTLTQSRRRAWEKQHPGDVPASWEMAPWAQGASEQLREAGIPGIKYLDQGSRGKGTVVAGDGKPTGYHNIDAELVGRFNGDWNAYKAEYTRPDRGSPSLKEAIKELDARGGVKFDRDPGTSNYVVFDDKLISILKKYGLPISAAGLAALSQLHPQEAQAAQNRGKLPKEREAAK